MNLRRFSLLLAAIALATLASATVAHAKVHRVFPGESIQAALDDANAGDTIIVWPGTYQETGNADYGLRISKDNIRLIAKKSRRKPKDGGDGKVRILHYGTQETGVYAAPEGCEFRDGECDSELKGFTIRGFTVEGFPQNGIQTRWVDGFKFVGNESVNNLNNGIYPTLSANGLVLRNVSYGSLDTAMWVAGSENVRVIGNEVFGSPIGFEITVSNNVYAMFNDIHDNTVGVGLFHPNAAGNPQKPVMKNWVIAYNRIYDNNLPNPAPPGTFQEGVPAGVGVLMLGVSDHIIWGNHVEGNDFVGIGLLGWCTAVALGDPSRNCINSPPQADPTTSNNLVYKNTLVNNGANPPPELPLPGADLMYLQTPPIETPSGNCFLGNQPEDTLTTFVFSPDVTDGLLPTDGC